MTAVEEVLDSQGIQYKISNSELITDCLECGKVNHFYINRFSGLGNCKVCGYSPNLYQIKEKLGIITKIKEPEKVDHGSNLGMDIQKAAVQYSYDLTSDPSKLEQISNQWGISKETLKKYYIGLCSKFGKEWITIPTVSEGQVWNIKYRTWFGLEKEFMREKGGTSMLYNSDELPTMSSKFVIITEGEKDALTLIDRGIKNVIGNSGGANTFKPEWLSQLDKFEKIFVAFDMDTAGESGARKLVKRLGLDRCYEVKLPKQGMDINDYFKEGNTRDDFKELLKASKPFNIPGVITLGDSYSMLYNRYKEGKDTPTVTTPWERVNTILNGGLFDGQLVTIAGQAKSLKTHISYIIAEHVARKGVPVFIYELEMNPAELAKRNVTRLMQVPYTFIDPLDILLTKIKQENVPIYIGEPSGSVDYKHMIETIKAVYQRFGVGFVVIDHAHLIIRSSDHLVEKIGMMVKDFAFLAKELEIPILLLAQPNKAKDPRHRDTYSNIGWSNAFATDSDVILIIHRNRSEQIDKNGTENMIIQSKIGEGDCFDPEASSFSPIATLYVDASRTAAGGLARLWVDPLYFTVEELDSYEGEVEEVSTIKKKAFTLDTEYAMEM